MRHILTILFVMGVLLWGPASFADIYTWTDENGVKHFGNQPPENATNAEVIFEEEPHNAAADQKRTDAQNQELTELLRDLEREEQREAAEARRKAAEAEKNKQPTQQDRVEAEKQRLETKIAELEEKPLDYFGSFKNKRVRLGYYRYRLETLLSNPDKYFNDPSSFEGNVKYER
ncbi:MAG: DUF4124 domain-containing protein [Desulfobacterales bacterium]|nr:DUF4124 domain-containing protein [Desulfobacterales bacterium]